jgi:protein arginine kinase activator
MKCDKCQNHATVHLTEIKGGKKIESHLCEGCAAKSDAVPVKAHMPINELLTNFVMTHSGQTKQEAGACEQCGITWAEFRQSGLLGCEHDYTLFERELLPLLQRAHEGATHHTGKTPRRGDGTRAAARPSVDLERVRKELAKAVAAEDYEKAARLRDQLRQTEARS